MDLSRVEQILKVMLGRESTLPDPLSRVEELLIELKTAYEEGGQEDPQLAARIAVLEGLVTDLQEVEVNQNESIAEKVATAELPSMTQAEYDALPEDERTALYYFIYEDEESGS